MVFSINKLTDIFNRKEIKSLLKGLDIKIVIDNNEVYLENTKTKNKEKMELTNRQKREISCQSKSYFFTFKTDNTNELYLSDLLIGEIADENYNFIMHYDIKKDNSSYNIKVIDKEGTIHSYNIKQNELKIEKITIKSRPYRSKNWENFLKEAALPPEIKIKSFYFYIDTYGSPNLIDAKKNARECVKEFIALEKAFPCITSYIAKKVPLINDCILLSTEKNTERPTPIEIAPRQMIKKYNN